MKEEPMNLKTNDCVNRDAASDAPTPKTEDGGSGSTPCSFSAIEDEPRYPMDMFIGEKGDPICCAPLTAQDIFLMVHHYKSAEFDKLINEVMELAIYDEALIENEDGYSATFLAPQSQAS